MIRYRPLSEPLGCVDPPPPFRPPSLATRPIRGVFFSQKNRASDAELSELEEQGFGRPPTRKLNDAL